MVDLQAHLYEKYLKSQSTLLVFLLLPFSRNDNSFLLVPSDNFLSKDRDCSISRLHLRLDRSLNSTCTYSHDCAPSVSTRLSASYIPSWNKSKVQQKIIKPAFLERSFPMVVDVTSNYVV